MEPQMISFRPGSARAPWYGWSPRESEPTVKQLLYVKAALVEKKKKKKDLCSKTRVFKSHKSQWTYWFLSSAHDYCRVISTPHEGLLIRSLIVSGVLEQEKVQDRGVLQDQGWEAVIYRSDHNNSEYTECLKNQEPMRVPRSSKKCYAFNPKLMPTYPQYKSHWFVSFRTPCSGNFGLRC